jgi:hypothetical protein
MPIVHQHSLESQVLASNLHLATHAAHHHRHDLGHGESGWHVHFVWPPSGGDDLPADEDQPAPTLAWPCVLEHSAHGLGVGELIAPPTFLADMARLAPLSLARIDLPAKPLPLPEIEGKRISPQAALCVARC